MPKHLSFPSIEQFRNVVREVTYRANARDMAVKPIIRFRGTVKSHGTNAGVVFDLVDDVIYAQSRSNVLSLDKDNAGFCQFFETNRAWFDAFLRANSLTGDFRYVSMYGEWCGGNIQSGVAITGLPKMFLVFALRYSNLNDEGNPKSQWAFDNIIIPENDIGIHSIDKFGTYDVVIDFNSPEHVQNDLVAWTEAVEKRCPIGAHFGVEGVGEGIVYHGVSSNVDGFHVRDLMFKVKGEKHSVTKVKTLAAVDVEVINNIRILVDSLATENRFAQGLSVLSEKGLDPTDAKNTRDFIMWVKDDVIKEERDTILASGLDFGKVVGGITTKAGKWYNSRPL